MGYGLFEATTVVVTQEETTRELQPQNNYVFKVILLEFRYTRRKITKII